LNTVIVKVNCTRGME